MAKTRNRLCGRCGKQQRTGNGYCKSCNAARMQEARGTMPEPETVEGQGVRELTDKTFELLEAGGKGTEVEVKGIKIREEEGGKVTFTLNNRQQRRMAERLKRLDKGA